MTYYNDNDPLICGWVKGLIEAGHLPPGEVDGRDIQNVRPDDVRRFRQVHFFAGIGGWTHALSLAGWGDAPVWTGSCPCQPFSIAGRHDGFADPRHLWPEWFRLIKECRPSIIFGEQVPNAIGKGTEKMLDVRKGEEFVRILQASSFRGCPPSMQGMLQDYLQGIQESTSPERIQVPYSLSSEEPCPNSSSLGKISGGFEGDGILARPAFGGNTGEDRCGEVRDDRHSIQLGWREDLGQPIVGQGGFQQGVCPGKHPGGIVCPECDDEYLGRREGSGDSGCPSQLKETGFATPARPLDGESESSVAHGWLDLVFDDLEGEGYACGAAVLPAACVGAPHERQRIYWVAESPSGGLEGRGGKDIPRGGERGHTNRKLERGLGDSGILDSGGTGGFWSSAIWVECRDGKSRPIPPEPALFPLADGLPGRVGLLRGAGNAIVPQVAAEFIKACMFP